MSDETLEVFFMQIYFILCYFSSVHFSRQHDLKNMGLRFLIEVTVVMFTLVHKSGVTLEELNTQNKMTFRR